MYMYGGIFFILAFMSLKMIDTIKLYQYLTSLKKNEQLLIMYIYEYESEYQYLPINILSIT